jgi:hypothetical protein
VGTNGGLTALGVRVPSELSFQRCRVVVKRSASQAVKAGRSQRDVPLPRFLPPHLPAGHEASVGASMAARNQTLTGFRYACIEDGQVQLLTGTCIDWTDKYPSRYRDACEPKREDIDGELCGVDEVRLPSFVNTQAATNGDAMCTGYYASRRCDPRERNQSELDDKRGSRSAPFGARRERQYGADDKSAIAIRHSTVPSCWSGVVTLSKRRREADCCAKLQTAAATSRHVVIAAARSTRCVWADMRWRWTLKML